MKCLKTGLRFYDPNEDIVLSCDLFETKDKDLVLTGFARKGYAPGEYDVEVDWHKQTLVFSKPFIKWLYTWVPSEDIDSLQHRCWCIKDVFDRYLPIMRMPS